VRARQRTVTFKQRIVLWRALPVLALTIIAIGAFRMPTAPLPPHAPARLLVVDDQPLNLRLIYEILGAQYQVFGATSGAQALAFCAATAPELILLDVVMPGMDGLETCRRLRADPATRDIPVIFVTGGTHDASEDACWQAGGADFVSKPIRATTLRHRVRAQLTLIEQSRLLQRLVYVDALTAIANRRGFDERFELEWRRARRAAAPLSVLMLDVDYFKRYNDRYGHPAGDACLRRIAAVLSETMARPADLCARYGGEEFACLLPETALAGALALAHKIGAGIAALQLPHLDSTVSDLVSASVGVAACIPASEHGAGELLGLADERLYAAKMAGRARALGAELAPAGSTG
jgi:diguanylate cyclase (GGDEF)-like protein